MNFNEILTTSLKKGASDVHLKSGLVPVIRKHGKLRPLQEGLKQLSNKDLEEMAMEILDEKQKKHFETYREIDIGYGISGIGRFRINIFSQRGSLRIVVRNIPVNVPSIAELNLPPVIETITNFERGLILVTGITGSGKSSTLAAMIDLINQTKNRHILTIEDPIEYLLRDRKSIISQRELGVDTTSFAMALRAAMRQDPDVILIGEMRDRETIETALAAAETGHLVLSTLHTIDAPETINRILVAFEPHQQDQIRRLLAASLKAIISQRLVNKMDKTGYAPAVEILVVNQRVKDAISDPARTSMLLDVIEESTDTLGMQSFDQSLMQLVQNKIIDLDEAIASATNPEDFRLRFSGVASGGKDWAQDTLVRLKAEGEWQKLSQGLEIEKDEDDE